MANKNIKKTSFTPAQEKNIYKSIYMGKYGLDESFEKLAKKYKVSPLEIMKAWSNQNYRVKDEIKKIVKSTKGRGGAISQFGVGKRGVEKLRKNPFELNKGGVVKTKKRKKV